MPKAVAMPRAPGDSDSDDNGTHFVSGEIDMGNAGALRERLYQLIDEPRSRVFVDLSEVEFIDSSGIAALIDAERRATSRGSELVLVAPSLFCSRVLEILGLTEHFTIRGN